jgi:hypothetical protein
MMVSTTCRRARRTFSSIQPRSPKSLLGKGRLLRVVAHSGAGQLCFFSFQLRLSIPHQQRHGAGQARRLQPPHVFALAAQRLAQRFAFLFQPRQPLPSLRQQRVQMLHATPAGGEGFELSAYFRE